MHYKINTQQKNIVYEKRAHTLWLLGTMCYVPSSPISYSIVIKILQFVEKRAKKVLFLYIDQWTIDSS